MFVADVLRKHVHNAQMLDSKGLLAELHRLRDSGVTSNADLARLLDVPSSRVAEIFSGKRAIKIDEMKLIVERYGLEGREISISPEMMEPLLDALLPLMPPSGRMTEQSRKALAAALSYGLELLCDQPATPPSGEVAALASRAVVSRFREIMN